MQFVTQSPRDLLLCQTCGSTGFVALKTCGTCKSMGAGIAEGAEFLYVGTPFTKYHIMLRRGERLLQTFQLIGSVVGTFGFLALFAYLVQSKDLLPLLRTSTYWLEGHIEVSPLLLACISFGYFLYHTIIRGLPKPELQHANRAPSDSRTSLSSLTWDAATKLKRKQRVDISAFFTKDTVMALEDAYRVADKQQQTEVHGAHLFLALLLSPKVRMIFVRLGIPLRMLEAKAAQLVGAGDAKVVPVFAADLHQTLFYAYDEAVEHRLGYIDVTELLMTTVRASEDVQDVLYELGVEEQKLENVIAWVRMREKLRREYQKLRTASLSHSKYGLDKAMTAVATPYLNNFSRDLTMMAAYGHLTACVARDKELDEIFRIVEGGKQSVLLVGEHGVGKMSIIEGIAERMVEGDVPARLNDKRLVQLSTSSLLAGTTVSGAQERLIHMMREISRAGNIILFINNIHDLMSVAGEGGQGMDVSETLAEYLGKGNFLTIATSTKEGFSRHILNSEIGTAFASVQVNEMDENQSIQVLESKVGMVEYKQKVFFSYDAIASAVSLSQKFLHEQMLPESAVSLMTEAASFARAKKGDGSLVAAEDVASVVSEKTGVPTTSISEAESDKLLRLEVEMHQRVIGQDEAVTLVANALRRARAEIRSEKKPIANFLFLGPTGVGKTELAKTIAAVYFGGEERMIRLDMSEYQDKSAVYRLIGQPGQQGSGLLTEQVRQHPFSLVLLDELEKADPDVLNIFLQVFDDGRLTDSVGRVIDFTNTIIIATSNAGTQYVQYQIQSGVSTEQIRDTLIRGELKQYYRPEFLNRFDAIVLFRTLEREDIKKICSLMLARVGNDLEKRGIGLQVEEAALESLADIGFDPEFGARPMRRAIQDKVENQLASLILAGKLKRKDTIVLGDGVSVTVRQ